MQKTIIRKNQVKTIFEKTLEDRIIVLEQNAKLKYILALKKGTGTTKTIRFELKGEGASLDMIGLIFGEGKEQFLFKTETVHIADHTYGHINMKGIMNEEAKTDYFGMIKIPKKNRGADGYLSHHTLLLSKKARARTVPSLEIEANDLKAGHSASVGQVSEEILFYIRSRGLSQKLAKKLLEEGFLEELIQKIEDPVIANNVRQTLFNR